MIIIIRWCTGPVEILCSCPVYVALQICFWQLHAPFTCAAPPSNHHKLWFCSSATPPTKSPFPKSILLRFGRVKWQNLSTAPDDCVYHLRIAVVASLAPENRPQNKKYFGFVPLPPPGPNHLSRSQFLSVLDRSSGKIYVPPLTNTSISCESSSSRSRPQRISTEPVHLITHPKHHSSLR